AVANQFQVLFEVQFEYAQRVAGVFDRRGDGHQRQDHVALLDVVLDPLGVNADVAFHVVEVRVAAQALDGVGADVQAVDFVAVVTQQALGQMVTDKAVHTEDQYAGTAWLAAGFSTAQHGAVHQAQLVSQGRTGQVQAIVIALTKSDYQRVFTAGDAQRVDADHTTWCQAFVALGDFSAPDNQFVLAHVAESARVRLGHGANQVEQLFGRFVPDKLAVRWGT